MDVFPRDNMLAPNSMIGNQEVGPHTKLALLSQANQAISTVDRPLCKAKLPCGHPCRGLGCNSEDHKSSKFCKYPCEKRCENGHKLNCKKFCSEYCQEKCEKMMEKKLPCGHFICRPCYEAKELTIADCNSIICLKKCGQEVDNPRFVQPETKSITVMLECKKEESVPFKSTLPSTSSRPSKSAPCSRLCPNGHRCITLHPSSVNCPPCFLPIYRELKCGHKRNALCGVPIPEGEENCVKRCEKRLKCGHLCSKLCGEDCACERIIKYEHPRCRHRIKLPCSTPIGKIPRCNVLVKSRPATCGHVVELQCFASPIGIDEKDLDQFCFTSCATKLTCDHICTGDCEYCQAGKFHIRCTQTCGKTQICGHVCDTPCSEACPPCSRNCDNCCEHGKCLESCGFPCKPCKKPCVYTCLHYKCTKQCFEVCDRPPCEEKCPTILKCGHNCIGFCGEPCPPLCFICDRDELITEVERFAMTDFSQELRFIYLTDCGHSIESSVLSHWMRTVIEDCEIKPKQCPLCRQAIWNCRRFNSILVPIKAEVLKVKQQIYGDPRENSRNSSKMFKRLVDREQNEDNISFKFPVFKKHLIKLLFTGIKTPKLLLYKKDKQYLASVGWLIDVYIAAETLMVKCELDLEKGLGPTCVRTVQDDEILAMKEYYRLMFKTIRGMTQPLTSQQATDVSNELRRISKLEKIIEMEFGENTLSHPTCRRHPQFMDLVVDAWDIIVTDQVGPYTEETEQQFQEVLKKFDELFDTTLGITEKERKQIVRAFGSRQGRFFKCLNGHIYVVTECGGPTEVADCPECGCTIGGVNHSFLEGNELASEMDDAVAPLYPTALPEPTTRRFSRRANKNKTEEKKN